MAPSPASSGASILRRQGSQKVCPQLTSMRGRVSGAAYCSKQIGQRCDSGTACECAMAALDETIVMMAMWLGKAAPVAVTAAGYSM